MRNSGSLQALDCDDDMYSGYNDFSPALATADIREHGLGILCPSADGTRQSTPLLLNSRRASLTPHSQLTNRRESFPGYRKFSEPRSMRTPTGTVSGSGVSTPWSAVTPRCRTDHGRWSHSPTGLTPRPGTDWARRTGTANRLTDASWGTRTPCPSTRSGTAQGYRPETPFTSFQDTPRPLSVIRAAYYVPGTRASTTSSGCRTTDVQTRLVSNPRSPALLKQKVKSPLEEMKFLEMELSQLFLECRQALSPQAALVIAKNAQDKERRLYHIYASEDHTFPYDTSLTFAVIMNLANHYEANGMYKEALNTYQIINKAKSDVFVQPFRVKINMGNLYVKLCQFPLAVKAYTMALDHVPREFGAIRSKILHNLGVVFFKTNQYTDAINAFRTIMEEKPNFVEGLNLLACLYALNCEEDIKTCFEVLLETPLKITNDESHNNWDMKRDVDAKCLKDVLKYDNLSKLERKLKMEADKIILLSAKVVAISICDTIFDGYDWCIEKMKSSQFEYLVGEIQITKATKLMNEGKLAPAISLLKELHHGRDDVASTAATNLAFIYLTQQDLEEAEKYCAIACTADCYNSAALVNSGCCYLARGLHHLAKTKFAFAVENDAMCFEALYDLGLANKKMGLYVEAMCCFTKLHAMFMEDTLVLYQLASIYELTEDVDNAMSRYQQILCFEPKDVLILKKIGQLFDETGDVNQAYQYYLDSYRLLPSQVDVLIWLGIYNLNMGCNEDQAIKYIDLAIQCQPHEIKWYLMVGSCHERSGNLRKAQEYYEEIHDKFPYNTECLKLLVKVCMPINPQKAKEYALGLKKLEKKLLIGTERPRTSMRSDALQSSVDISPTFRERIAQTDFANCISSNVSNVFWDQYNSFEKSHQPTGLKVGELFPTPRNTVDSINKSRQAVSPNESLCMCDYDNECVENCSSDVFGRYDPDAMRWQTNNESFDPNYHIIPRPMPVQTFLSSSTPILFSKQSQPPERGYVQSVAMNPTCSLTEPGSRGYVGVTPRVLFTKVTGDLVAHDPLRMRDGESQVVARESVRVIKGDSLCDLRQGQHLPCRPTPRSARLSSREPFDVGLKMFADSSLGADLLPD